MTSTRGSLLVDDGLLRSIKTTYRTLRIGLGSIALALPPVLAIVGFARGVPLQSSLSAYYYTAMRDVFVGVLFAAGAALFLYKGYSRSEDWVLDFAGTFAIGVALFPTKADAGPITVHGVSAVLFFVCLAYVAIFRASETLALITDEDRKRAYQRIYGILGTAMLALPAIAAVLVSAFQIDLEEGSTKTVVFFVESAAIYAFGLFWLVKSHEIHGTQKQQQARPEPGVKQLA
jgi:hypothetical protein